MTATFRAELIFGSNAEEAAAAAVKASDTMSKAQINAQSKIAATIARGDPLKALQVQQFKELQSVYELEKKKTISVQQAEAARKELSAKFAKERLAIEQQTATQMATIARQNVAANGDLEKSAKQLKEQMSNVGSAVQQVGSAFGGMGGQAVGAGASIVGSFGAGGVVGVALAATGIAITAVVGKWQALRGAIKEAAAAARQAQDDLIAEATRLGERADAELARVNPGAAGGGAAEQARRARELAASATGRSTEAQRILLAEEERKKADARLRAAMIAANANPSDAAAFAEKNAAAAAANALGPSPGEAVVEQAKRDANVAERLITTLNEAASKWEAVAAAEQNADAAKNGSRAGAAVLAEQEVMDSRRRKAMAMGKRALDGMPARSDLIDATRQEMSFDIPEVDAATASADKARRDAVIDKQFASLKQITPERLGAIASDFDAAAEKGALAGFAEFGLKAGETFLDALDAAMKAKNPKDIFGAILGMIPGALGLLSGFGAPVAGAGIISGAAGFLGKLLKFDRGGPPAALMPAGRDGLAMMPGSADGKPAIFHPGEVVMRADVAQSFPGGFGQAVRVGMGLEPLPSGGGVQIHQHVHQSFAPTETRAAYQAHLAPAMAMTFEDRQSPLVRSSLARSVAEPRSI